MRKTFIAPNCHGMKSAHAIVESSAAVKPSKRVGWEMQKQIPRHVKDSINRERAEREARGFIVS